MTSLGQIGNSPKRLNRASIQAHPSFGLLEYLIKTNSRDSLIAMSTKETCSNTAERWPMSDHQSLLNSETIYSTSALFITFRSIEHYYSKTSNSPRSSHFSPVYLSCSCITTIAQPIFAKGRHIYNSSRVTH